MCTARQQRRCRRQGSRTAHCARRGSAGTGSGRSGRGCPAGTRRSHSSRRRGRCALGGCPRARCRPQAASGQRPPAPAAAGVPRRALHCRRVPAAPPRGQRSAALLGSAGAGRARGTRGRPGGVGVVWAAGAPWAARPGGRQAGGRGSRGGAERGDGVQPGPSAAGPHPADWAPGARTGGRRLGPGSALTSRRGTGLPPVGPGMHAAVRCRPPHPSACPERRCWGCTAAAWAQGWAGAGAGGRRAGSLQAAGTWRAGWAAARAHPRAHKPLWHGASPAATRPVRAAARRFLPAAAAPTEFADPAAAAQQARMLQARPSLRQLRGGIRATAHPHPPAAMQAGWPPCLRCCNALQTRTMRCTESRAGQHGSRAGLQTRSPSGGRNQRRGPRRAAGPAPRRRRLTPRWPWPPRCAP